MRSPWTVAALMVTAALAASPAAAAGIVIPDDSPEPYSAYASQAVEQPWTQQRPDTQVHEQPIGELIATRLGLAQGSAELFRYHLENAPSARTQLDGIIDGGGIKLKLTW